MIDLLIGFINKNFTLTTSLHCGFSLMLLEIIKKAIILHVKALIFVSFNFAAAAVVIVFFSLIFILQTFVDSTRIVCMSKTNYTKPLSRLLIAHVCQIESTYAFNFA